MLISGLVASSGGVTELYVRRKKLAGFRRSLLRTEFDDNDFTDSHNICHILRRHCGALGAGYYSDTERNQEWKVTTA
jgi:hypothetical protein